VPGRKPAEECSIQRTLDAIGDRWTLLIMRDLFRGVRRFTLIQSDLGIARNLLTDRLASLMAEGVVKKVQYQSRPVRHEYHLTEKGRALSTALVALMRWGDRYYSVAGPPVELVHDVCRTRLELQPWCTTCNMAVEPTHIRSDHTVAHDIETRENHEHAS